MSGITIWGGKLATAEAALAQATASGYEFAKVVTAMSAIYSQRLRRPPKKRLPTK